MIGDYMFYRNIEDGGLDMRERKEPCVATEHTRFIFLQKKRAFCHSRKTLVASDQCWLCPYNIRKKYDPSKPKETVECLNFNRYTNKEKAL